VPDYVFGDSVGRDKIAQKGHHNKFTINNSGDVSADDIAAAVAELQDFVEQLRRTGAVAANGSVTDPGAVVRAVHSEPSRLKALTKAVANGAKDAVLSVVRDGVSGLIVGLVSGQS